MIKKLSIALVAILTLGSCAREFNKVYRTTDTDFKYEYAKECYVQGQIQQCRYAPAGSRNDSEGH